jgi:hypothetical protein
MLLSATNENLSPQPRHPEAEYAETTEIARYCVVVEVALYHRKLKSKKGDCAMLRDFLEHLHHNKPTAIGLAKD